MFSGMDAARKDISDTPSALDWETLGRLVRRATFDAIALHFAARADDERRACNSKQAERLTEVGAE